MFDHVGHGLVGARESGGRGRISNWWIDAAPWRCAVPRQSAPVSPPPMITTRLPDVVTRARELLRGRQTGRPRPHDSYALTRLHVGDLRCDPSLVPGAVDDLHLDLLDGDRVRVDPQHARGLARRGAQTTGELGEVV